MCNSTRRRPHKLLFPLIISLLLLFIVVLPSLREPLATVKMKENEPARCYKCHEKLREGLSKKYTHFLFREGRCSSCHDPHVSDHKNLLKTEINSLCLNCHKKLGDLLRNAKMHAPLNQGQCTDCHYGHSGEYKSLLLKAEDELCWVCHENLSEQLSNPYIHPLFEQGGCSSCHEAHGSKEENLLHDTPAVTCKKCHGPRCKTGNIPLTAYTVRMDCTGCHSGHGSKDKGLLGPFGHTSFLEQKCEQCHEPFAENRKITTRIEGTALCFSCHEKTSPTKYIDNDVHIKDAKNACMFCHIPHASERRSLTKDETAVCGACHENTEKRTAAMERALRSVKCTPVTTRKCFDCHMIGCSSERPLYFSGDTIDMCVRCHKGEHKTSHPLGPDVKDPRNGKGITCITCHSMHSAGYNFMLVLDGTKALCIQCHKIRT